MTTDEMIPRITVRDESDALLIIEALNLHMHLRITELNLESRRSGADQYALSLDMIKETDNVCTLLAALGDELNRARGTMDNDGEEREGDSG